MIEKFLKLAGVRGPLRTPCNIGGVPGSVVPTDDPQYPETQYLSHVKLVKYLAKQYLGTTPT